MWVITVGEMRRRLAIASLETHRSSRKEICLTGPLTMTLHYATQMNDEAHGHAQDHSHPLGRSTITQVITGSAPKPGYYHFTEPKQKSCSLWRTRPLWATRTRIPILTCDA